MGLLRLYMGSQFTSNERTYSDVSMVAREVSLKRRRPLPSHHTIFSVAPLSSSSEALLGPQERQCSRHSNHDERHPHEERVGSSSLAATQELVPVRCCPVPAAIWDLLLRLDGPADDVGLDHFH
jgi:hypothetical protein